MKSECKSSNLIEIFSSIQGEGPYIGERQLFIRFADCNLKCAYCDTEFLPQEYCKVEMRPGSGKFKKIKNPINIESLIYMIRELTNFHHHSLSLTGGEPLMSSDFLNNFLESFSEEKNNKDMKVYLETNGTLPGELIKIINQIDIISMDLKIESSTKKPVPWQEHKKFIHISQENNKEIFAKIVITSNITSSEISDITNFVHDLDKEISLVLQPVSSQNKEQIPTPEKLLNIQEALLKSLKNVRIIPQVHKLMQVL